MLRGDNSPSFMRRSTTRRAFWFGAVAALGGCTSLTAVDWTQLDDAKGGGGRGGSSAGSPSSGGALGSMSGSDGEGGDEQRGGMGGEGAEGGAPPAQGGSGGSGGGSSASGAGGTSGGATSAGGGAGVGSGGTSAGSGGTSAGSSGSAGTSAGTAGSSGSGGSGGSAPAPVCGDGTLEGSECEPPNSSTCSDDCVQIATQACVDCEQAGNCWEYSESCLAFTGAERSRCFDVQQCIVATGCGDGASTLTSCFCGNLSTGDCIAAPSAGAAAPAGQCASKIREAMGGTATTNSQVLTRYTNLAFPGGAALARFNCVTLPENAACKGVCGF